MNDIKNYYVHPLSDIKAEKIGYGTKIWQFCVIFSKAKIGENCNICSHVLVESEASIGANSTIFPGVKIGRNAIIGPGSVVTKGVPDDAIVFGNLAKQLRSV